jgi:hypothetical protein
MLNHLKPLVHLLVHLFPLLGPAMIRMCISEMANVKANIQFCKATMVIKIIMTTSFDPI